MKPVPDKPETSVPDRGSQSPESTSPARRRILIVEDDSHLRQFLTTAFQSRGDTIVQVADGEQAVRHLSQGIFDGVLCDFRLPGLDGFEVLRAARRLHPEPVFILMTGYGSTDDAVAAIKTGADDYVQKPISVDEVFLRFERAFNEKALRSDNRLLKEALRSRGSLDNIVGQSKPMQDVFQQVHLIAPTDSTVLLTGESGTGKELVARAVHSLSPRRESPFLSVHCGAIPEGLLEDELFGHVKGAFTGADQNRTGYFEAADRGTLFLDEVSSLGLDTQSKLLRAVQQREIRPLGSTQSIAVDVRIIAATNTDLGSRVKQGHFREDLFYRLNVIPIRLPSLRERREDVPALVQFFLAKIAARQSTRKKQLSQAALHKLVGYDWPGNVRQLENAIEMAAVLTGDRLVLEPTDFQSVLATRVVDSDHLPDLEIPDAGVDLRGVLGGIERKLIEQALVITDGNRNQAARLLKINRTTLVEKLKRWKHS